MGFDINSKLTSANLTKEKLTSSDVAAPTSQSRRTTTVEKNASDSTSSVFRDRRGKKHGEIRRF